MKMLTKIMGRDNVPSVNNFFARSVTKVLKRQVRKIKGTITVRSILGFISG
jgi:hypothetical protein